MLGLVMIRQSLLLRVFLGGGKLWGSIRFQTGCLYITADCGGSNSYRAKLWKYQLQQFVNRTGLSVEVSHFPPGTSKWNKVEHRLFCYVSKNWTGQSLVDVQSAVDLIGSTRTKMGLEVVCVRDDTEYELSKKVRDEDFWLFP